MARFPKIDQPCPLGIDEQRRSVGYCARCEKSVYDLTAFDDDARVAFMREKNGPLCVSYRVPRAVPARHVGAGLGAALAISVLTAHPAMAAESRLPVLAGVDESSQSSAEQAPTIETAATPAKPKCRDGEGEDSSTGNADVGGAPLETITLTGGVNDPAQAHFVDDSELSELPMLREDAAMAALPIEHERANASVKGSR
jgi:hypothetical protein